MKRINRPHLRWRDYDNDGNILPAGLKRLKDGTIIDTTESKEDIPDDDIIRTPSGYAHGWQDGYADGYRDGYEKGREKR